MLIRMLAALALLLGALPSGVAADTQGRATATVRIDAEGAHVSMRLSRAVTRFDFADAAVVRSDFEMLTPSLTLSGDAVAASAPFRRFDILIRPALQERDAKYPAFFRVGEGGVVYAPALIGAEGAWRTEIRYQVARGQIRLPTSDDPRGSVFVGPRAYASDMRYGALVAAPDTPAWLLARARTQAEGALDFYTERLGIALPTRPTFILAYMGDDSEGQGADVTPGPVVSFRMYGAAWLNERPDLAASFDRVGRHETFHFWNGALANSGETTPSWLHEGSADFAALLAGIQLRAIDDATMRAQLGDALSRCRSALVFMGDVAMNDLDSLSSGVRYPCGIVIQWAADLEMRTASNGARDVLDAWRATIAAAVARPSREYGLADFYRSIGADGPPAVARLLTENRGPERWTEIVAALEAMGADIVTAPNGETRGQALILHLLRQSCASGQSTGYGVAGQVLRLDTSGNCGAISGSPVLSGIESFNPLAPSAENFATVQALCARGASVQLTLDGDREVNLQCRAPLPAALDAYEVRAWR